MPTPTAIDVTTSNFATEVIARSSELPVIADFWAPWCGPCRTLGPILERLIGTEFAGKLLLAKINTDESQELSRDYRIQGIPAVKAFRDGAVIAEFVGALPEVEVRQFLLAVLPTPADDRGREALSRLAAGEWEPAEAAARAALAESPMQSDALMALGELLLRRGETEAAIAQFRRVVRGRHEAAATRRVAELELLREAAELGSEDELAARLSATPDDLPARYGLALLWAGRGDHREALEALLEVVRRDRKYREDGGRKAMLRVFEMIGVRSPLADEFRDKLAGLLY